MAYVVTTSDDNSWWFFGYFIFFFVFFLLLICLPSFSYYRRSDYCGDTLPAERYMYRPSTRYIEVDEVEM